MTYSIVARDPETGALGVGVQSHYFGAGSVVPWAEAGVGAVATQSVVEIGYGPRGLAAMREGTTAPDALRSLVEQDPMAELRQVAMIDASGRVAVHTGAGCVDAAGDAVSREMSAQANMMLRASVWDAMTAVYEAATGDLAMRIVDALDAAEAEGGDARGRQSAGILVVSGERTDEPWNHVLVNVRVDDDLAPLVELRRLVGVSSAAQAMAGTFPLLFAPAFDDATRPALDAALATLDRSQEVLGDANREPTFWKAVLLAKDGRVKDARVALAACRASRAEWAEFLARLPGAGLLPDDAQLLASLLA